MSKMNYDVRAKRRRVGLIYDDRMCKHSNPDDDEDHPENPGRIRAIWKKLNDSGTVQRCVVLNAKEASRDHLALGHSQNHIDFISKISSKNCQSSTKKIAAKFDSVYLNEGSSEAANLAAGSVIEAAEKVAKGELDSAFAIIRPPGHHAEKNEPMGFCLYNNVAIAASYLLNQRPELHIKKILIVDWDLHHGNGTQKMFYKDPRVLFFSVHRHANGKFYPYGNDGSHLMSGEGRGAGYNINVPWEGALCGDADYIAVWNHILMPVAKEFEPDMILISAGFDAAVGDPVGVVSSNGYSIMLDKMMDLARGKIVMALEGGHDPVVLANSVQACVEVLLLDRPLVISVADVPLSSTWRVIREVRQTLCKYWPVLASELPEQEIKLGASQIEVDIGVGHSSHDKKNARTIDLQANTALGADISARENLDLADESISRDYAWTYLKPDRGSSSASRSWTVGSTAMNEARPRAAGLEPSKRARTDDITPLFNSGFSSYFKDENFILDDESQQHAINKDKNKFRDLSLDDLTRKYDKTMADAHILGGEIHRRLIKSNERVIELEDKVKASEDRTIRLRNQNKKVEAARCKAQKALDYEIATGSKYLESEAGKRRLEEAKNEAIEEYKKSEAFQDEISNAASRFCTEAIELCRTRHLSSRTLGGDS